MKTKYIRFKTRLKLTENKETQWNKNFKILKIGQVKKNKKCMIKYKN